jgi:hypothetical protein
MIEQSVARVAVDAAQDSISMQLGACACIMEQSFMCVAVVPGRDSMINQPSVRAWARLNSGVELFAFHLFPRFTLMV